MMYVLSGLLNYMNGTVDFHGQMLCEVLMYAILITGTLVGTYIGFQHQDFTLTLFCLGITTAICVAVCTPGWPFFCRNQIKWKPVSSRK
ncbi:Microsomal signal peptidase 12 kDa subunit (SPC12) family protein [Babesia bovis T2Bo]|uniref:Microsomal signal peptidase 12 kDa subunit (SPC12) family protein n=1 Tax=Babesia bovis T2Bo TaxID=484906 RepID=UPI001D6A4AB1|nr:Microsomal signal peptidase 12 kDa subunit (SPC12) family protein [Babesia bovis T2Bo]KAG6439948.1 Microsomal signal peptidase 12 kDa subunit (SPC12) family protein [Babesia bovis T2Bo]